MAPPIKTMSKVNHIVIKEINSHVLLVNDISQNFLLHERRGFKMSFIYTKTLNFEITQLDTLLTQFRVSYSISNSKSNKPMISYLYI